MQGLVRSLPDLGGTVVASRRTRGPFVVWLAVENDLGLAPLGEAETESDILVADGETPTSSDGASSAGGSVAIGCEWLRRE